MDLINEALKFRQISSMVQRSQGEDRIKGCPRKRRQVRRIRHHGRQPIGQPSLFRATACFLQVRWAEVREDHPISPARQPQGIPSRTTP